jgi:hypothetical protein
MVYAEFTVTGSRTYDRRSPARWVASHILRYPVLPTRVVAARF